MADDTTAGRGDARDARDLARVAGGDRLAFERLYRAYVPRLARFLRRYTHDAGLVEELVDDTLLVAWRRAAAWDASCKVSTWLFAIAARKARKALRRVRADERPDLDALEAPPDTQPEHHCARLARRRAVDAALATLAFDQRVVVQLSYFHDMDYARIADVLRCAPGTVKTRMALARKRLAPLLAQHAGHRPPM